MPGIIYTPAHADHKPESELHGSRRELGPHPDNPERVKRILDAVKELSWAEIREFGERDLSRNFFQVHASGLIDYFRDLQNSFDRGELDPFVADLVAHRAAGSFSNRTAPRTVRGLTGWYCTDAQTPLTAGTWGAVCAAFASAVQAAELVRDGTHSVTYALCRPPGHHAGRDFFGGYCYLNNAAGAASVLARSGPVAILDIDYHHGNGTQQIFYGSKRVFTASLHADPEHAYPFYSGYTDERGTGAGRRKNLNLPLPSRVTGEEYLKSLDKALGAIKRFRPKALVLSFGADIAEGDPIGDLGLTAEDVYSVGQAISKLNLPTVICQEGGYNLETIGEIALSFLRAFDRE